MGSVTAISSTAVQPLSRERKLRIALRVFAVAAALILAAALGVAVWARHSFTTVEAMVALHVNMFASGEGLYYPLNEYPYTIAAYGPIYYALAGGLHLLGVPLYMGARLVSWVSMLAILYFAWRILKHFRVDAYARSAGVLLAASTTTLVFWGTVGQVDMLAIALSLAAFDRFLAGKLNAAGGLVVLSVFTKQTAVAAGATIALCLLMGNARTFAKWAGGVAAAGLAIITALQLATGGAWIDNAVFANINPFEWPKLEAQVRYFVLTSCGVLAIAIAGIRGVTREQWPLHIYTALATLIWLVTAPKAGSDLNYQIEMTVLWILCAACALDRLSFFPKVLAGDRTWVTLLQVPLVLHLVLNVIVSAKSLAERAIIEPERRTAMAALAPYLGPERKLVLVNDYDALVQLRGRTDVETLIYSILVNAGRVDPAPVVRHLEQGRFSAVVLWDDLFAPNRTAASTAEAQGLPPVVEDAIRARYRLVTTIPEPFFGPYYIYEPRFD